MSDHILGLLTTQIWQIAALAIVVAVVVKLAARNRPHLAHALWVLVLIKCVTPPLWGHSLGVFSVLQTLLVPDESASLHDVTGRPKIAPVAIAENMNLPLQIAVPIPEYEQFESFEPDNLLSLTDTEPSDAAILTLDGHLADIAQAEPALLLESVESHASGLLLSGLLAGAMVTLLIMIVRCLRCLRLIHRHRTTEFDAQLCERIQQLSEQLRIRRIPRIIVSDVLFGPAVLGLLRHTIVLPRCLFEKREPSVFNSVPSPPKSGEKVADRPDEGADRESSPFDVQPSFLDPILAHELLHIRRGDLRTGTLQAIVQSLWWFHPAVWLSNRWLSREAERCCDEQVIAELGCTPGQYARSLLSVIECKHQLQPIPVFPGMKPVEITAQRMERIMSLKNGLKKRTPLWCWLMIVAMAFIVLPGAVAKPWSDEKIVAADSGKPIEPSETKTAAVSQVEVSTKTYDVGDLVERLAQGQKLSAEQARQSLVQIFEASVSPVLEFPQGVPTTPKTTQPALPSEPLPEKTLIAEAPSIKKLSSFSIDDHRLIVVQSHAGHSKLQEHIDRIREFGFTQFQLTARYIMGPAKQIDSLMSSLKLERPFNTALKKQVISTSAKTPEESQPRLTTYQIGTSGIISREQARTIEELARSKADCFAVQCPQVSAFNGQLATIHVGETKPFIVGFKENDEPMIRTVVEGLTLRVTPTVCDSGLYRLQSVACLEGASQVHPVSVKRSVTETPRKIQVPTITTKQIQTTVELQDEQALLQTGLTTTHEGKTQAVLVILEARPISPELADLAAGSDSVHHEPSGVGLELVSSARKEAPIEIEQSSERLVLCSYPVADLVIYRQAMIGAGSQSAKKNSDTAQTVPPAALALVPERPAAERQPRPAKESQQMQDVKAYHADFAPLMELIKATVQPESWTSSGNGTISIDKGTLSLLIRQTQAAHEEIAELLPQLCSGDQTVRIHCRILKLTSEEDSKWLGELVSLHELQGRTRWALLSQQRSVAFQLSLKERKANDISAPLMMTISGQTGTIQIGSIVTGRKAATGIRLEMTPHLLPDSKVIRLQHSFSIGEFANEMPQPFESLVGSGQTLLLLIDDPEDEEKPDAARSQYLLMMTPERMPPEGEAPLNAPGR